MTDRLIENSVIEVLQDTFNYQDAEILRFPDMDEEFTFTHPNASILVNAGDIIPGNFNLTGQELEFEIEFNVYARKMRGVGGASDIGFKILKTLSVFTPDFTTDNIALSSGNFILSHWQRLEVTEDYILLGLKFNYNGFYIIGT